MYRLLTAILLALAGSASFAADALACSCAGPAPGESRAFYREMLKQADGAVVARVKRIRIIDRDPDFSGEEEAVYTLRVRRAFKRLRQYPRGRVLRIRTSTSGSTCGLAMEAGEVDGLFLYRQDGRLSSSLCSRIEPKRLRRAARDRNGGRAPVGSAATCGGSGAG